MPELIEQMYCSQQIVIPPKYPYVLKRYCKAAIKTQPYDLLRWSFEYFRALAEHRPPPVKLRLEYPVYSTEGGLTRGCLKVLGHQLYGMSEIPTTILYQAWQGFCLDLNELKRILCLCEVYLREESVPYLHFMAVAGGMLTKCLTHTMILLCESLTKEPDGGSAAIPVQDFVTMYEFLANIDAARDVKYFNGFREGYVPPAEEEGEEEGTEGPSEAGGESHAGHLVNLEFDDEDDYWGDRNVQRLSLIDDAVAKTARVSVKLNMPLIGKIERSPSIERAGEIERDNYMRERRGRPAPSEEIDKKLQQLSAAKLGQDQSKEGEPRLDEDGIEEMTSGMKSAELKDEDLAGLLKPGHTEETDLYLAEMYATRDERMIDIEKTYDDIAAIVDKCRTANYDLGMVAGRQMSTTSGEFIVHHIEKEIMDYIDEQIAILPDPDLKKKKAKPEEVLMIRDILEQFLEDNMEIIVPEIEEVEEEEPPIPEIVTVYAVPGIGGPVDADIMSDFVDYSNEVCKTQGDLIMPRNIRHFMCPPLEKYIEINYDVMEPQKEEVATAGAITE